ncbi:MAG: polyprenol monophosphomannose synthase [Armatimonadetes bacterium]|nr:polyprenol monophosphomannose synthase [Armatimonadota bacterium]
MIDPEAVFVVTATYNEAANLPELHRRLRSAVPRAQWVVVDDASPDGTAAVARSLAQADPLVQVIERVGRRGYASAHQDGMRRALEQAAEVIVTLDADLSHDPSSIPTMIAALAGHDIAIGSRYAPGGGFQGVGPLRRMLSRFANAYVRAILRLPARDCTSGFRAYRADVIERSGMLREGPEGYVFLTEALFLCVQAGARLTEVPITYVPRGEGKSKMSARIMLESAARTLGLRFPGLRRGGSWR